MILACSSVAAVISTALLSALVATYPVCLWPLTAILGASIGAIIPSSFVWVGSFMEVRGWFSAAFWSGFGVGYTVAPVLIGHLINYVNPMWFAYVMLACSIGLCLTHIFLRLLIRCNDYVTADVVAISFVNFIDAY